MIRRVTGPKSQIKPIIRGFTDCRVMGFDSETYIENGFCLVNSLQFAGDDWSPEIRFVTGETALPTFCAVLEAWASREGYHVCFAHNLSYDLTALLLYYPDALLELADGYCEIEFPGAARLEIYSGRVWFADLILSKRRRVRIVDSLRFSFASLDATAKLFNVPTRKLAHPAGLGERRFTEADAEFCNYAIIDAETEYHVGKVICDMHKEFDIPLCVSAAQMSARVFRKSFLREPFPTLSPAVEESSLLAFHGGVTRAQSGFYDSLTEYDLCSAYPAAMKEIGVPKSFRFCDGWQGERNFYLVRGRCLDTVYPALHTHDFKPWTEEGQYWVTGYELNEARVTGEFRGRILRCLQIEWQDDNPLARFVDYFFDAKAKAKADGDKVREHFYKRGILNSLYGKFIQTQPTPDGFTAGGLYFPPLAALITGYVRATLHRLEHLGHARHAATDSVKTAEILPVEAGLGGLTREIAGPCVIVRGKLYAHQEAGNPHKWKLAAHGLGIYPAERAWSQILDTRKTSKRRVVNVKVSRIRGLAPLTWFDAISELKHELPKLPHDFLYDLQKYLTS